MNDFMNEIDFELDNFGEQKIYDSAESLAKTLLNLFFLKPGSLPSLPHIGINITQYLYNLDDGIDVDELKNKIYNQCPELIPHLIIRNVQTFVSKYKNQSILIISIPIEINGENKTILYGFGRDDKGNLIFNFEFNE